MLLFSIACMGIASAQATPPSWVFHPKKAGNALYKGGWTIDYSLGSIHGSSEFSFPLQLVYLSTREQKGLFGSQWFCPQLESSVIPKGQGMFAWTMPSGSVIVFKADPKRAGQYISFDGNWRAEATVSKQEIFNQEGWRFSYKRGHLEAITSPTNRQLIFLRSGDSLQAVQIRDGVTGESRILLQFRYGGKVVLFLQNADQIHRFGYYQDGSDDRLGVWAPPVGHEVRFFYNQDSGVLSRRTLGSNKENKETTDFTTTFVQPFDGAKPAQEPNAKKNPKNYWLTSDGMFTYRYGVDPDNKERWLADEISLNGKTGVTKSVRYAEKRGAVTAKRGALEQKTSYFRAPGQKFNGKLRRIEQNGRLQAEYRYDKKTGLLSEVTDVSGLTTFFDYPADWKPLRKELWEPKPIRIRRGNRNHNEMVAEFSYNDLGQLVSAKNALGNAIGYAYDDRGQLAVISNQDGGKTSFTYDNFGRCTSVAKNGVKESLQYDDQGRVKARIGADGSVTNFIFDKHGELSQVKRDGQPVLEYQRDPTGQLVSEKDPAGRVTKMERDSRGNILAEYLPNGTATRYVYDELNRRIAQTDGNGGKVEFSYDAAGHLVSQVNALGDRLTWKYDDSGKLIERANGEQVFTYTYDSNGRVSQLDYGSGQTIEYTYDKEGRMSSAATPNTRFEYLYDKLGRIEAVRAIHGTEEQLLRYRYNSVGNRDGLILATLIPPVAPAGGKAGANARYEVLQQTEYTYDTSGRLSSIVSDGEPVVSYKYDAAGRAIAKSFGNGMSAAMSYDGAGRLTKVEFSGASLSASLVLSYEWDVANQLKRRTWNGETQRYEYDGSGQLLNVIDGKSGSILEAYMYDKAGNMLEKVVDGEKSVMTYNAANQLVSLTKETGPGSAARSSASVLNYLYDKAGRMRGAEGDALSTYGWLDKVVSLKQPDGTEIGFEYWPDGQLAKKLPLPKTNETSQVVSSSLPESETFLWDGLALLRRNSTVYVIEPHLNGGVPVVSRDVSDPRKLTYYLNDLLGTTLATIEGGIVRVAKLTAFGQPLKYTSNVPQPNEIAPEVPGSPLHKADSPATMNVP
ncbi:MAG TPA: hypothetical protein VIS99_01145 [Terrimicrobiaceae bacterium]